MKTIIQHPTNEDLSFEAIYFPAEKSSGEWQYAPCSPPIDEHFSVERIFYRGQDITNFVVDYCDNLFEEFEEKLAELKKDGRIEI